MRSGAGNGENSQEEVDQDLGLLEVTVDTGQVVGFGFLRPFHHASSIRRTAEVTYFILREFTKQGIGTNLLNRLIEQAVPKGTGASQTHESSCRLTNKEPQKWELQRDLCQDSELLSSAVRKGLKHITDGESWRLPMPRAPKRTMGDGRETRVLQNLTQVARKNRRIPRNCLASTRFLLQLSLLPRSTGRRGTCRRWILGSKVRAREETEFAAEPGNPSSKIPIHDWIG